MTAALGFDVGGQSVKAALVDDGGRVLGHDAAPTGADTTPDRLLEALSSLADRLAGPGATVAAGLGVAGALDPRGALRGSPHLPLLVGRPLGPLLAPRFGAAVPVRNDADCAAVAEGWGGAADGQADYLALTVGTGIGSGLVLGGRLRAGASAVGCELGHMILALDGRPCACGHRGCVEAYVSESAARVLVAEADAALRGRVEARRRDHGGGAAEALFALASGGDVDADNLAVSMVHALGVAIGSALNVVDVPLVVIGGGIGPGVLERIADLRRAVGSSLFARDAATVAIVAARRGALAGAIGAARLAMPSA